MKIVVCSDNHYNFDVLKDIVKENPDADYYWHLGDSEASDEKKLSPFISVHGNNDFINLPTYRVIELKGHRFFLTHGHRYIRGDFYALYNAAIENKCDVILYGHTHVFADFFFNDVHFLNPGSCRFNRDGSKPSYLIINIDDKDLSVVKKELNNVG